MYKINFREPCRIHFIGIGGISMSFAEYLHNLGYKVSGSDSHKQDNRASSYLGIEVLRTKKR